MDESLVRQVAELIPFVSEPARLSEARRLIEKYDVTEAPAFEQLREWLFDSIAEATDGCQVEPDGRCPHGRPSWLVALHLM